jgi:hypothetical protein
VAEVLTEWGLASDLTLRELADFLPTDPPAFGTFSGTRGSFSDIGTGRWHGIMVFRIEW